VTIDQSKLTVRKSFDINERLDPDKPGAMLPTVGTRIDGLFGNQFAVQDVDQYLAALHGAIGDTSNIVKSNLMEAAKALGADVPQAFSYSTMAFMPDPGNLGLMQWPGLNPESLRKIARENIVPQVVIRSRVADLARYSQLSTNSWQPGWNIAMRQAAASPSEKDKTNIRDAEKFIANCSMDYVFKDPRDRDASRIAPFEMFLRSFADDSLTFDGWAIWTDMDSSGRIRAFCNLSAGLIRLTVPYKGFRGEREHFAAMVDETGSPILPLTRKQLTWRVRNVRLDPAIGDYGWPEIEMCIRLIQGFQSAIDLNVNTFSTSGIPNGMLVLKGDYFQQNQIDALMREWTNMKRGVSKMWGLPVISIPEDSEIDIMQFMDIKGEEVRYKDHMNMMMGCACLIYNFPPRRLGMFASGNHRDNQPVQDAAIEIQGADDPGLPPLLMHIEDTINQYLLWPNWPNLRFFFNNKNPKEDARSYEARKLARTWGEARAQVDEPKLETLTSDPAEKKLMKLMELCPEDPSKQGVFQSLAAIVLETELGVNDEKNDTELPGARMTSKKDPAQSQGHGHLSGVRRDSKTEK